MQPGSFIIDGVHSDKLKSLIQYRPELETPRRKVKLVEVSGRSGDIPFDEEAYENTTMSLTLFTMGDSWEEVVYNRERIVYHFDHGRYVDFIPYFDSNKTYRAMLSNGPSFISSGLHPEVSEYTLDLTIKPYKMLPDVTFEFINKSTVINKTFYTSEPRITIYGSGDITLKVNDMPFVLKGVDGTITIDTEVAHSYKITAGVLLGQDNKVYTLDYPVFNPGENVIEWIGNVAKVVVSPKWRTLI